MNTQMLRRYITQPQFGFIDTLTTLLPEGKLYLVGGVVRDVLLGRPCSDVDFVIRNVPLETLIDTLRTIGIVNIVGKHFGVIKFTPLRFYNENKTTYDIALPRAEHAQGTGGYRDVTTQSDPFMPIAEDLSRRDYTVNAMAYDVRGNMLIDEHAGLDDLKKRMIRTVGDPASRFEEDYSRMLRGLRFAVQLNFSLEKISQETIAAMIHHINEEDRDGVRKVPYETIAKELMKSVVADPVRTMDLWDEVGAWQHVMPELLLLKGCPQHPEFHSEGDVWTHTRLALQKLYSESNEFIVNKLPAYCRDKANPHHPDVVLAVLLHDIAKPDTLQTPATHGVDRIRTHEHESVGAVKAGAICERLKLSNPEDVGVNIERVVSLVRFHLLLGHGAVKEMKPTTIEKYFFKDTGLGCDLLLVIFADGSATLNPRGVPATDNLYEMIDRINELLAQFHHKTLAMKLPKPLLDGNDIMQALHLKPGKLIGQLLAVAREAQLSGEVHTKEEMIVFLSNKMREE